MNKNSMQKKVLTHQFVANHVAMLVKQLTPLENKRTVLGLSLGQDRVGQKGRRSMGVLAIFCWFLFLIGLTILLDKEVPVRSIERTFALLLMSMCALLGVFLTAAAIALAF